MVRPMGGYPLSDRRRRFCYRAYTAVIGMTSRHPRRRKPRHPKRDWYDYTMLAIAVASLVAAFWGH